MKTQIQIDFDDCNTQEQMLIWFKNYFATIALNKDDDNMLFNAVKSFAKTNEQFLNDNSSFCEEFGKHIETEYKIKLIPKDEIDWRKHDPHLKDLMKFATVNFGNYYATTITIYKELTSIFCDFEEQYLQFLTNHLSSEFDIANFDIKLWHNPNGFLMVLNNGVVTYNIPLEHNILTTIPYFIGRLIKGRMFKV